MSVQLVNVDMSQSNGDNDSKRHLAVLDRGIRLPNEADTTCVFKSELVTDQQDPDKSISEAKEVTCDSPVIPGATFASNEIITSRYTVWNFLPKNLWEQFHQKTNIYFLFIGALQLIDAISTTEGVPSMYVPLSFVLGVSAVRSAFEDRLRHKEDNYENSRTYHTLRHNGSEMEFQEVASRDLVVGDLVVIESNGVFPADMVFLHSAHKPGHCFVETSNLDGETNLKVKMAPAALHVEMQGARETHSSSGAPYQYLAAAVDAFRGATLMWEAPNAKLAQFSGWIHTHFSEDSVQLEAANLLLRGTSLKNTEYVLGCIVYSGDDTKVRQNSLQQIQAVKIKSSVIHRVDRYLLGMLCLQTFLCMLAASFSGAWHADNKNGAWYLQLTSTPGEEASLRFFTWFIILSQFVPISLLVTGEFVKTFQSYFMNRDLSMWDARTQKSAQVRSLFLNEDLGQVEYVFSDKTGTLTQNIMQFRACIIKGKLWGSSDTEISKRVDQKLGQAQSEARLPWTELERSLPSSTLNLDTGREASPLETYVNFDAREEMLDKMWGVKYEDEKDESEGEDLRRFLTHMCISNTVTPVTDEDTGEVSLEASSPDELSLCSFAKYMGFSYQSRNPTTIHVHKFNRGEDETLEFDFLASLDFNSKRKRVTMIYKQGDTVFVMTKGADSSIMSLLPQGQEGARDKMYMDLEELSTKGLRTLVVAYSELSVDWWQKWKEEYEFARSLPERDGEANHTRGNCTDRCRVCKTYNKIEEDAELTLFGATAIDDQLQSLVPEAIEDFLEAGIKVWMLTGDKMMTAKNIGIACNLIDPDMDVAGYEKWTSTRLLNITGTLSKLDRMEEHQLRDLYAVFKRVSSNISGTREQYQAFLQDLHLHKVVHEEQLSVALDKVNAKDPGSFAAFIKTVKALNLSLSQAVEADISRSLQIVDKLADDKPVSMILEGAALAVLYQPQPKQKLSRIRTSSRKSNISGSKSHTRLDSREEKVPPSVLPMADDDDDKADSQHSKMRDDFFYLASKCKSVVACRLTPYQKSLIVEEVQQRRNALTCAIGDGANDEPMIRAAHVGVGISGLEGSAAANASDYSISQFRFLHTLLFVHGYWNYDRISTMVVYIFYKTIMMRLVMYWFGAFSGFSGEQFFSEFVALYYNVAMTATPIMILSTFDQRLSRETLENTPAAYRSILRGHFFNKTVFYGWIARSVVHSLCIFFLGYGAIGLPDVINSDGKVHGRWVFSNILYLCCVFVSTFRICLEFTYITWLHQLFVWLSLFGSYAVTYLMTTFPELVADLYGSLGRAFYSGTAWLTIILLVSVPLLIGFTGKAVQQQFCPRVSDVLREEQLLVKRGKLKSGRHTFGGVPAS